MIGAKEFAIKRKVIEKKKNNPLVDGISIPKFMRSHENNVKNMAGSFLDKLKPNGFSLPKTIEHKEIMIKRFPKMAKPHDTRTINPILEESDCNTALVSKKPKKTTAISPADKDMFAMPPFFDFMRSNMGGETKHKEPEEHEKCEDFSDELTNHITYKVFQNIKDYLEKDSGKSTGNRQIKLEISL